MIYDRIQQSLIAVGVAIATTTTSSAFAAFDAEDAVQSVEEIVVTGSRLRKEDLQRAPVAVSVITSDQLETLHARDIIEIAAAIPNVQFEAVGTAPGFAAISIRGFNTRSADISIEPGIPVYVDGIYQAASVGNAVDTYDIDRIEVLRGPQGTLLGKNASAGAVLLTRSRPTGELGGKLQLEYGSYDLIKAFGLVNLPIVKDTLALKVSASIFRRGDWVKNVALAGGDLGGENRGSVRAAIQFTPNADFKLYLTADYNWNRDHQRGDRNVSIPTSTSCALLNICGAHLALRRSTTAATFLDPNTSDENNVTAIADWTFGGATLTSVSGYRHYTNLTNTDFDGSPAALLHASFATTVDQYSQEVRLSSVDGAGLDMDGKLVWLIGGYYGYNNSSYALPQTTLGTLTNQSQRVKRTSTALFGHIDYTILDDLILSAGARQSWDQVRHLGNLRIVGSAPPPFIIDQDIKFSNTSFEAGAQYNFSSSKMMYFRYAEGYRGGGFQGMPASLAAAAFAFEPELSTSYEAGVKTDWLDRKLRFNATLFNTNFSNLQRVTPAVNPFGGFVNVLTNAASATSRGVELEMVVKPSDAFTLRATGGYLDIYYKDYVLVNAATGLPVDRSSEAFEYAPKFTFSVGADYMIDFGRPMLGFDSANLNAMVSGKSSYTSTNDSNLVAYRAGFQSALQTVDASVTFYTVDKNISLALYVQNLFDKRWIVQGGSVGNLVQFQFDNIGRTGGITLNAKF